MCNLVFTFVAALIIKLTSSELNNNDEDYYWRHYNGTIPTDAIPGGLDEHDKVTYIGQIYHKGDIVPGEIHPEMKTLLYEYGGPLSATENVRILCSSHPEIFEWITVTSKSIKFLWSKNIVQSGHYSGGTVPHLIGRTSYQNKAKYVGKVPSDYKDIILYFNANGAFASVNNEFEILSYNPHLSCKKASKCEIGGKNINLYFNQA